MAGSAVSADAGHTEAWLSNSKAFYSRLAAMRGLFVVIRSSLRAMEVAAR